MYTSGRICASISTIDRSPVQDRTSGSAGEGIGTNVVTGSTAMNLTQKRLEHRERPQGRAVVALAGLVLIEQRLNRRHVEQARPDQ